MTDKEMFEGLKKCADEIVMGDVAKASLVDSGERTNVGDNGAVRESPEGKGRMDLVPCDFIVNYLGYEKNINSDYALIADRIEAFKKFGDRSLLVSTISWFADVNNMDDMDMLVGLSKHFQAGAVKYSENNWQKGMPVKYYISSAERHLAKHILGLDDENHAMAFIWNLCAAWWTCRHRAEYNDYSKEKNNE